MKSTRLMLSGLICWLAGYVIIGGKVDVSSYIGGVLVGVGVTLWGFGLRGKR